MIGICYKQRHDHEPCRMPMSRSGLSGEADPRHGVPVGNGPEAAPAMDRPTGSFGWKRWRRGWLRVLIATQLFSVALLLCRVLGGLQFAELAVYDRLVVAWSQPGISDRVVLVNITEDDIGEHGWPLRDADLATLLQRLTGWGARAIGVDLYRDRPLPPGDEVLSALRARHPEIVWTLKLADKDNRGVAAPVVASLARAHWRTLLPTRAALSGAD